MLGMEALPCTWEAEAQSYKFEDCRGTRFHDETLSQTSKRLTKKGSYMWLPDTN